MGRMLTWSRGFGVVGLADAAQFHRAVGVYASLDLNLPTGVSYDSALFADGKNKGYAGTFIGGSVGIGTTSPSSPFQVAIPASQGLTDFGGVTFQETANRRGLSMGWDNSSGYFWFYSRDVGVASRGINLNNALYVKSLGGSVGIGTTAPGAKLDVRGADGYLKFDTSGSDGTIKSDYNLKLYADDTNNNSSGYQNIQFYTAGANERMRIAFDGKIQIGNNVPMWSGSYGGALFLKGNNATSDRYAQLTIVDSTGSSVTTGLVVSNAGDVGIGTVWPNNASNKATLELNAVWGGVIESSVSGTVKSRWDWSTGGITQFGTYVNEPLHLITNSSMAVTILGDGNVGIGSASPAAPLDVPRASDYKVIKLGDDITSHYVMTGNADHTLTLTCASYFQAEIVITANQTNGGVYNNLYIRGIWSNNHTSHHWDEIETVGSLGTSTFTITNGQNGVLLIRASGK